MSSFDRFDPERMFHEAWGAVEIVREVPHALFTFGESVLPYFLVCGDRDAQAPVSVTRGDVRVKRPMIVTPDSDRPEFHDFFENAEEEGVLQFLLARTAQFSNLKFVNQRGTKRMVEEDLEAAVDRLNRRLDDEEEEHVAILTAPPQLAGIAVLRYAAERVWRSAPSNIQELRERGFLP